MENLGNVSIDNIVNEISSVLSKHLTTVSSVVNKIQEEKKDLETILLGIPYVKDLKKKNDELLKEN
mgnify:FL=1